MKTIILIIISTTLITLSSCIKEQTDCCKDELLLQFSYTLNKEYSNKFEDGVEKVMVYIFDNNGKFVDKITETSQELDNDYIMRIPIKAGVYSVVAYGGTHNTYIAGDLDIESGTIDTNLIIGKTEIDDFHFELVSSTNETEIFTPNEIPSDIYVGLSNEAVSMANNQTVTLIELMKDTKNIEVNVNGTNSLSDSLEVFITATNGRYDHNNNIEPSHGNLTYLPHNTSQGENTTQSNLKIMRLIIDPTSRSKSVDPAPTLVVRNSKTKEELYNKNMINEILSTQNYSSQEDLDREDSYKFDINIDNNMVISVSVNGWKVIEITPNI